jgi:hypothetical protein
MSLSEDPYVAALDEIGAIHKPRPTKTKNAFGIEFDTLVCRACYVNGHPASWPCRTMQAIDVVLPLAEWSDHYRSGCDHGMSAHNDRGCVDCGCTTPGLQMPVRSPA